jgi:hypothetical protein
MIDNLHANGFPDRRTEDLHARYDSIEQRRFALRVARNHKERDRLARQVEIAKTGRWVEPGTPSELEDWLTLPSGVFRQAD